MQVFPEAVIINISPSQKKLLCDPKHVECIKGVEINDGRRPRIPISEIPAFISCLEQLKATLASDPDYAKRQPGKVIDQIILKLEGAAAAQRRAYPKAGARSN